MKERNHFLLLVSMFIFVSMMLSATVVIADTNNTGNRIWDADENVSLEYTWNALSYSGFYFDLDSGEGSETLTVKLDSYTDRSINDGDLEYSTTPINTDFDQSKWGSYQVIGFMAERYFAGYTDDTAFAKNDVSLISGGELTRVLMDSDREVSLFSGSSLTLNEGYELNIVEVDLNGNSVLVTLEKNGREVDTSIVSGNDDYVYEKDIGSEEDVPIIAVHFNDIFRGVETNAVFVEGIFQISENYVEVESGDKFGKMEIKSLSENEISLDNSDSISLGRGNSVTIMGKLKFLVADDNTLRFGPVVDMSEPGIYELRGTVAEDEKLKWTPLNFEGFYYNIDEGIGTESLEIRELSGRRIDDGDLVYRSIAQDVSFDHNEWGEFQVIGFLAEKYFAGYPDNEFTDDVSMLSDGQLSKVLIDNDRRTSMFSGSALVLEEGYRLRVVEVDLDGSSVLVSLDKNGKEVDTTVVSDNDDYVYEKDIGSTDDVPMIVVHFRDIFRGTETNAVFIEGIFQISEDYVEIESNDKFGEMEVSSFSSDEVTLRNEDTISLTRDKTIAIMGNIHFKVADSGSVRYYPFIEVSTLPSESLSLDMQTVLLQNEPATIKVTSRGAAVQNAVVMFGNNDVGMTSREGIVSYTPETIGMFTVSAEKEGFTSANFDVEVVSPDDASRKLAIEISPDEVKQGDRITISTLTAIDGEAVEGVELYYDGILIGSTNAEGSLRYTVQEAGVHKISSMSDDYLEAEFNLEVLALEAAFSYSNLQIAPLLVKTGENVTISVDVMNTGTVAGETDVELLTSGEMRDSKTVSLDADEETTVDFSTSEEEAGSYEVQISTLTGSFEVEKKFLPAPGIFVTMLAFVAVTMLVRRFGRKE
ncbi:S-layer protein domain-containing protein [Methanolobus sp. ZRKC3]|uniref:S-layer protein domain-containing protein n=1 Tax=Methanolobus sp. ZRKC3 TaxID=3125786 RepID=UPI00324A3D62